MSRNYTLPTVKQLFAEAIACAHPGCDEPLIFHERGFGTVVADIAHIRSESDNGPRYDKTFRGDINGVENLLLLCGKHHRPVDRHEIAYSVEELLIWKQGQVEAARAGGTAISDEQASAFVQLSAEEGQALAQVARLSERVLTAADRAVVAVERVSATREAEVQAFVRSHPVWEVDDDGTRTPVGASQISLPNADEDHYRAEAQRAVLNSRQAIEASVDALREEIAVLRMRSSGGLDGYMDAVVASAIQVRDNVGDRDSTVPVRVAVAALWRAANGEA